jgi:hypothetical protein
MNLICHSFSNYTEVFFWIYISWIVYHAGVRHRLAHLSSCTPNRVSNISLILNSVFFTFFLITIFCTTFSTTKSFIVTYMCWITFSEFPVSGYKSWSLSLFRESFGSTVSHLIRNESAMLFDNLTKRLIFVQNFTIKSCVFVSLHIFFLFIGVFFVSNLIELTKRFWCLPIIKAS